MIKAYLGVDIGSVSTNIVALSAEGEVLSKQYVRTNGQPIECAKQGLKNLSKEAIHALIEPEIKALNKSFPVYKYIKDFSVTDKPLIKTTTQKIKRHEEIKKIKK